MFKKTSGVTKLRNKLEVMLTIEHRPLLPVSSSVGYSLPVLISCLFASVALEMTSACSGHGKEAGDGPEAGRDSSPLPGCGHGGVCGHRLLYPGHDRAAPLPEKVGNSPDLPLPPAALQWIWSTRKPILLPTSLPIDFTPGRKGWTIILRVKDLSSGRVGLTRHCLSGVLGHGIADIGGPSHKKQQKIRANPPPSVSLIPEELRGYRFSQLICTV